MIFSQQFQDSQFSEQILMNHHPKPTLLYCTPPHSPLPMSSNLGHPNRSCVSCKKRKVKCDRKTPSCAACVKSKHRCYYTSYSPPEDTLATVPEDEAIKAIRQQHWIQTQRMNSQPTVVKNEYDLGSTNGSFLNDSSFLGLNVENPTVPIALVSSTQYVPTRFPTPQLAQIPTSPNSVQQSYILPQQRQQISTQSSPLINQNTLTSFLQPASPGTGPMIPPNGFANVSQLQLWIHEKIIALSQEWRGEADQSYVLDPDERLKLRMVDYEQQGQFYVAQQQFDVEIERSEYTSGNNFDQQTGDFKPYNDLNQYDDDDRHSGNSNPSSIDIDPMDTFLHKIYAFVRKFMRDVPWLRDNFMLNFNITCDGVLSDVAVEIRRNQPSLFYPQQNRQQLFSVQNDIYESQNDIVKGRLFL
ncbi:7687_t:CDS:2 [Racocetra fulgida]|uniref:7687_t:CDS:1 n=1 Tax=Racocetra fulgida TaxID=60492 RepID=A0A9N8Z204_9GLOM|nr:7687_t:CDS:2 [Racocetra fulgida]